MDELVTDAEIAICQADGVVCLRGLFADWVEILRAGVDRNLAEPGPDGKLYHDEGGRLFLSDYCNWQRIPEYEDFLRHSSCAEVAARLMGSTTARLFHEHVLVKEPGATTPTPWHHDQPYYCVDGRQNVSIWVALDPVARDTSVEFVAGSHRWSRTFMPERFNRQPLYGEAEAYERLPDIEANRADYDIRGFDVAPGDAICFHFLTVHGAPGNRAGGRYRRAFSARWIGDDARFAVRPGPTSPPFRGVALKAGDAMDAPEFPLIWPRAA
jgi:ectoine hydroxylase-related dioxygenase (phytanoyl-CoA dioxygenase family)